MRKGGDDILKNMTQAIEQAMAGLKDLVMMMASHRENLLAKGFSREESMELVIAMQNSIMKQGGEGK